MRKIFASLFFVVWFAFFLQLAGPSAELFGKWSAYSDEGKTIEGGVVVRYDSMLKDHRTDNERFNVELEDNAYQFYVRDHKLRMEKHAWWFVNHLYGGKLHWCVYPAISAANLSSRIVDTIPWFVGATVVWFGLWFFLFRQIKRRPDTWPETYLPAYHRPIVLIGYFIVYLFANGRLFDNERSMLLLTLTLIIAMGVFEIFRFVLHGLKRFSEIPFAARNMQRNAADANNGGQRRRSWFSRWWGRHFRA